MSSCGYRGGSGVWTNPTLHFKMYVFLLRTVTFLTNVDHRIRNLQISLNSLDATPSAVFRREALKRFVLHMCVSNLIVNVNKYNSPHWSLSPSDVTLRLHTVRLGLHYRPYGNWFVATYPCSLHLSYSMVLLLIN